MFWYTLFLAAMSALLWAGVWMRHISLDLFVTVLGVVIGTLFIGFASLHFLGRKNRQKMKRDLPLTYTFKREGFTSHLGQDDDDYRWDDMKDLTYHKRGVTFNFKPQPKPFKFDPKAAVSVIIMYASPEDILLILKHVKKYAPEKLSKDIKL